VKTSAKKNSILLLFCDKSWDVKGVIEFSNIDEAKEKAEKGYKGISGKWKNIDISKEELDRYLRDEIEVDPNTDWWKTICSFCGKEDFEETTLLGSANENVFICENCIRSLYEFINDENA
jgi:hypothetical protein